MAGTDQGGSMAQDDLGTLLLGRAASRVRLPGVSRDAWIALGIAVLTAGVYLYASSRDRENLDYFVRLADAFLHGRIHLLEAPSWLTELIPRDGVWYVPYPPMPAVLLVPFVVVFGTDVHQQIASSIFGAVGVGLTYLVLCRFGLRMRVRILLTATFAFGTCFFYTASTGNTWYLSHVSAVMFATAAIVLALDRRWPLLVGLLVGFAALSRLPVILTVPFYMAALVGLGWPVAMPADRRAAIRALALFVVGLGVPLAAFALYNIGRFGSPLEFGYALIPGVLQEPYYQQGIFSIAYIPRHLYAIFAQSWIFEDTFPWFKVSWWGLGVFLTTPLFLWLLRARLRDSLVPWAALACAITLVPILTHGNVGFTQFGYRFSLDVQPLLFVILATVFARGMSRLAAGAAVLSIAICAYGVWAIGTGFVSF